MEIVNSCETNNGGCSHVCHHTSSGPVCTCNFGFRLEEDQKSCTGKEQEKATPWFPSQVMVRIPLGILGQDPSWLLCVCTLNRLKRIETDGK